MKVAEQGLRGYQVELQAGHKALHTCMSWYAFTAMFSSSDMIFLQIYS